MTHEDYKEVLETVRSTLDGALRQNEMLIRGLKYYAESDWRTVAMVDRGERAKKILAEVMQ
jgi:hypothetical protein